MFGWGLHFPSHVFNMWRVITFLAAGGMLLVILNMKGQSPPSLEWWKNWVSLRWGGLDLGFYSGARKPDVKLDFKLFDWSSSTDIRNTQPFLFSCILPRSATRQPSTGQPRRRGQRSANRGAHGPAHSPRHQTGKKVSAQVLKEKHSTASSCIVGLLLEEKAFFSSLISYQIMKLVSKSTM